MCTTNKMAEIYMSLEVELKNYMQIENVCKENYDNIEKEYLKTGELLKDAAERLKKAKSNREAVEMAVESLNSMDVNFKPSDEDERKEELIREQDKNYPNKEYIVKLPEEMKETNKVAEEVVEAKEEKPATKKTGWRKIGPDGKILGEWKTQKEMAIELGCDQSRISQIMKESDALQMKKRGYIVKKV